MNEIWKQPIFVAIDLESYYDGDKEHPRGAMSLRSMSAVEYVRDDRFDFHLASVISPQLGIKKPHRIVGHEAMVHFFDLLRPLQDDYDLVLVGANSGFFDALVFKERFDFWFTSHFDICTMSGLVFGNRLKNRKLETIASYMKLPGDDGKRAEVYRLLGVADGDTRKASIALQRVKGMRLDQVAADPALLEAYGIYCDLDALYSWQAFEVLHPQVPESQMKIANLYYNSFLAMPLTVDVPMIRQLKDDYEELRQAEIDAFAAVVKDLGVTFTGMPTIRSADKFAQLLRDLGVPDAMIPRKPSPKKVDEAGRPLMVYAFSKTDLLLEELAASFEDGESLVPEACRLRLEYNTSTVVSKYKRFAAAGSTGPWAFHVKPFGAANTVRHSGGNGTGACFTGEMELLTPNGWVRADELERGVEVMQYDRVSGACGFVEPLEYHEYVSEDVYAIQSSHITGHFTGNHRWWGKRGTNYAIKWQQMHVCDTQTLSRIPTFTGMPLAGVVNTPDSGMTDDMLRFHVMVQADGNLYARSSRQRESGEYTGELCDASLRFGFVKQRKVDMCIELLGSLGIPFTHSDHRETGGRFVVRVGTLPEWFVGKYFGPWVLSLSSRQLGVLLHELTEWDGCNHKVQAWRTRHVREYTTGRYDQAEWVQTMAHLTGQAVSVYDNTRHELGSGVMDLSDGKYAVYFKESNTTSVAKSKHPQGRDRFIRKLPGSYRVYCVSVPSECILVRHNDNVFVTMNSPQNLKRAKPTVDTSCGYSVRLYEDTSVRDCIGVPDGRVLTVCDLSGIEMRTGLTLSDDQKYIAILRDPHRDVYCETATDVFERLVTKKDKQLRFVGKLTELSCIYGVGWRKLLHTSRVWNQPITADVAQLAHAKYRLSHPPVVATWEFLEELLTRWALKDRFADGEMFSVFEVTDKGLRSPTGFLIQYPNLQVGYKTVGRGRSMKSFTYYNATRRCVCNVHRGLVLENCIAEGTEVLTEHRGWVAIETLADDDRVWNGDEWCSHGGLLYNNIQPVLDVAGVHMTADHMVMTDTGWVEAKDVGTRGVEYAERKIHKL